MWKTLEFFAVLTNTCEEKNWHGNEELIAVEFERPTARSKISWVELLTSPRGCWRLQLIIKTTSASFDKFPSSSAVGVHSSPHWFLKGPELEQVCFCIVTARITINIEKASASGLSENQLHIKPLPWSLGFYAVCFMVWGMCIVKWNVDFFLSAVFWRRGEVSNTRQSVRRSEVFSDACLAMGERILYNQGLSLLDK